ncbi:GNAT family N-acetyltransferase [Streptococcus suis]|uniref:GNAT family N-acetyltransferase n=1 Tax=Streptococcus suis TaxID=1307 RepID=UPI00195FA0E8|nr:GNAT family N-acetyltransferase [Streptococcus suis]MBM7284463.1 GNAT family N-acetyltransferase [Streptococcus suis]MBO3641522.1 GNAT family N-acetyltransferase [Streptococcus suis]MCO8237782.1 GNAT family N-acetyltransferase [Streptococcus suis]HEM3533211.1 GNAT family N-acetyltransferase [Streptococcus suis]
MQIVAIRDSVEKADIIKMVLADLPEWFGLPESTKEYIQDGSLLPLWAAFDEDEPVGFVTLMCTSDDCGEVHCMGVKKSHHRKGLGRALMQALEGEARKSYAYLQVKTVDQGHYETYDKTIAFYHSCGFAKLEVFPNLWDEWNPCLIMIKKL